MTDNWFIQDVEKLLAHRNRVVIVDPAAQCGFMVSLLEGKDITVLKTDGDLTENWQHVKEELFLRYEAETKHAESPVVFYVNRPIDDLSFLFDYCFTHGCIDLTHAEQWVKEKLFTETGLQVTLDSSMLLTAAKLSFGKGVDWWKKILHNLEDLISLDSELLPFLHDPKEYFKSLDPDVRKLFETKLFELTGQPEMSKPPESLAKETVTAMFEGLLTNEIMEELLNTYYKWADSATYRSSLKSYIADFKSLSETDPWKCHHDHCFETLDRKALRELADNLNNEEFVEKKLRNIRKRTGSGKVKAFVPNWWEHVLTLLTFNSHRLSACASLDDVVRYYTTEFAPVDRAIRYLYMNFLSEKEIIRPFQEYYENLNKELLESWYKFAGEYKPNQQGYLVNLFKVAKPKTAVIVGDGISFEIANFVASKVPAFCEIERKVMLADMPSETEHNMSALYIGDGNVVATKKEREKRLSELTGKEIVYLDLEALNYGEKSDYLVLSYKDIDDAGEKLQHGAIKLFAEFEKVLVEKIELLFNIGYESIFLVTDHGFVLTGLLEESDKISVSGNGKIDVKERYFRAVEKQDNKEFFEYQRPYGEFEYVYAAKNHRPFRSKGVYGFSHGGFTPQEIIIPDFRFTKRQNAGGGLQIVIQNKSDLEEIVGNSFVVTIKAEETAADLFSVARKMQIILYADGKQYQSSSLLTIKPGEQISSEFTAEGHKEILAVLIDGDTKEQLDKVTIKQSTMRDLGGLL